LSDFKRLRGGKFRIGFSARRIRQLRSPRRRRESWGERLRRRRNSGLREVAIAVQFARSAPDEAGARVDLAAFEHPDDDLRRLPNPEFLDAGQPLQDPRPLIRRLESLRDPRRGFDGERRRLWVAGLF